MRAQANNQTWTAIIGKRGAVGAIIGELGRSTGGTALLPYLVFESASLSLLIDENNDNRF